jgi:AhpD family alkylhydroperoxidase
MTRKEIYGDMEATLGVVPTFFKSIPDSSLELEWNLMKKVQLEESPIPAKYRELIGVAISAATKCHYCTYFHTEFAKLNGATEAEIEDAVHYAKSTAGWSTYVNGTQVNFDQFRKEVNHICEYVGGQMAKNR